LRADGMGRVVSQTVRDRRVLRGPGDGKELPLLQAETRPRAWQHWLKATGTQGLDPATGTRLEHTYFLLEAAASGLGVAIGSVALVEQDLQAGRLVAPFGFIADRNAYCLLRPAGQSAKGAQITAFVDWVRKEARRPAVPGRQARVSSLP